MVAIVGTIESKSRDGKGIKINGEWYSAFTPAVLQNVSNGDTVNMEYTEKAFNGKIYKNIKNISVANGVVPAGMTGTVASAPLMSAAMKPGEPRLHTQAVIARQNAINVAGGIVAAYLEISPKGSVHTSETLAKATIDIAMKLVEWTTGEVDFKEAEAELGVSAPEK